MAAKIFIIVLLGFAVSAIVDAINKSEELDDKDEQF